MASIQSLGVGSGLLTSDLVDDIIAAEREATDLRIDAQRAQIEARVSAFGTIRSSVAQLRSSVSGLGNSENLLSNTVSSSNEAVVNASATTAAQPGIHSVEVLALARSNTLVSQAFDDTTTPVGTGSLTIRLGTTTFVGTEYDSFEENSEGGGGVIEIDESNSSLTGIRDAVNEADAGVNASIVNDGAGFRLVFTAAETGAENSIEVVVDEADQPGLSAFSFSAGAASAGTNFTQTVVAEDAVITVDGITVSRTTNSFEDVIEGLTINATALTSGVPINLSVARDNEGIIEQLGSFVDAYNDVLALTDQLTEFNEDEGVGSLLIGDSVVRGLQNRLRATLNSTVSGITNDSLRSLVDLGITTDQNNDFRLRLNTNQFRSLLNSDPAAVQALLADDRRASDDQIIFNAFQNSTEQGTFAVEVTSPATQGAQFGATVATGPFTIDATNDLLRVQIDGVSSEDIQLTQGSFADGAALAAELQIRINSDSALQTASAQVSVAFNEAESRFEINSTSFGESSIVAITSVGASTEASLGFAVDDGEASRGGDVAGLINGIDALGSGQFLVLPSGPQPASSGFFESTAVSDVPEEFVLSESASLSIVLDGTTSGSLTIPAGTFTGSALAEAIEDAIDDDPTLSQQNLSASVEFNPATGVFRIESSSAGTRSRVDIASVSESLTTLTGLGRGNGEAGRAPTDSNDPAAGIQLQVLGEETGNRGDVTLVRGSLNQLDRFLDDLLDFGGTIDNRIDGFNDQLADLDDESETFDTRIEALESRLRQQFAGADALISQLNSTASFLTAQLDNLPGFSNDN